jgi:hypothetical protein
VACRAAVPATIAVLLSPREDRDLEFGLLLKRTKPYYSVLFLDILTDFFTTFGNKFVLVKV